MVAAAERKRIGISIPCFNEQDNVAPIVEGIMEIFKTELPEYDYMIQFIDNNSTDQTRSLIRGLCKQYPEHVRAIFNAKNFPMTSGYYGMLKADGDCTINIPCDFQVPIKLIVDMVKEWENGAKVVCLIKKASHENKLMWGIRQLYYKLANRFSDSEILRNFNGSGLYDRSIMDVCRQLDDSTVSFIQFIAEFGYDMVKIQYTHTHRQSGKTKNNFKSLINIALTRFVNSSTSGLRVATVLGAFSTILSFLIGLVFLVLKLIFWNNFIAGLAPLIIGFFFVSSIQIFFIGLVGEYVIRANKLLHKRPLVIERERLNFAREDEQCSR
jgi:polyisoprenyl-phosphate glycosyltransferase